MPKLILFLLFSLSSLMAQSNQKHVVYFETDKYEVLKQKKIDSCFLSKVFNKKK